MTTKTKLTLNTRAEFTWGFGHEFLLRVVNPDKTNAYFVWSDPDYSGNNTIRPYIGSPADFTHKGFCGRDKGEHFIGEYCGNAVRFVNC